MIFVQYPEDCLRIQRALLKGFIYATIPECQEIWEKVSEDACAGWLSLPADDDQLYEDCKKHFGPIEGWND